jgi:hypothetical protein
MDRMTSSSSESASQGPTHTIGQQPGVSREQLALVTFLT